MNEEMLSALLDGELTGAEAAAVEAAIADDPILATRHRELTEIRTLLRGAVIEPPVGAIDRIVAEVDAAEGDPVAPVVSLASRRRRGVPTFAAAAAAMVIIASVVGGVGGSASIPALGDFVRQHQAAAAVVDGDEMPAEVNGVEMDPMPMERASGAALPMPDDYSMRHAFTADEFVHLVYLDARGVPISVFRHEGDADVASFADGHMHHGDKADMWTGMERNTHVAVIDGSGYVWVVVSAEPHDDMMEDMMADLPTRSPSIGDRARDAANVLVEPFRFGG